MALMKITAFFWHNVHITRCAFQNSLCMQRAKTIGGHVFQPHINISNCF